MRMTQTMLSNNMLTNLNKSYGLLGKYQEQLYTQQKISRPSDDPVIAVKGIQNRRSLEEVEQYNRNLGTVYEWLENSEDSLDKTGDVIHRITDLVTRANNGSLTNEDREKISTELEEMKKHVLSIANTKVSGKYIFSGSDTKTETFSFDTATSKYVYNGNTDNIDIEISEGMKISVNQIGDNLFGGLLNDIQDLQEAIKNPPAPGQDPDLSTFITKFQDNLDIVVSTRAKIGATTNRAELIETRLSSQKIIATKRMSENEDIDVEEVIMNLKTQESIHRAALSVGASIIQPTLVDFMR
ncbi:flagellar hook-associated protein FlgL [Fredinandcohnia quinoae]|uniref:Flagellar hook-associated protein FlgL n=1 Tax=Fredinandcohnia quinoae TaxID=2918902 RepID=A0AAW5E5A5_9BACI|nr:flagellar hook-associated protein FlgL [Fredinandcohnia sp. SECRCQ15]MCH1625072.1 flagellar hook-associated protein FlgL [Fredinandcohnia sp. SECRCQ15]